MFLALFSILITNFYLGEGLILVKGLELLVSTFPIPYHFFYFLAIFFPFKFFAWSIRLVRQMLLLSFLLLLSCMIFFPVRQGLRLFLQCFHSYISSRAWGRKHPRSAARFPLHFFPPQALLIFPPIFNWCLLNVLYNTFWDHEFYSLPEAHDVSIAVISTLVWHPNVRIT